MHSESSSWKFGDVVRATTPPFLAGATQPDRRSRKSVPRRHCDPPMTRLRKYYAPIGPCGGVLATGSSLLSMKLQCKVGLKCRLNFSSFLKIPADFQPRTPVGIRGRAAQSPSFRTTPRNTPCFGEVILRASTDTQVSTTPLPSVSCRIQPYLTCGRRRRPKVE